MFKRSLASLAAVAIASGAVVAPANAVTVKVNDDKNCTINLTAEEAKLTHADQTVTIDKERAANLKAALVKNQLSVLGAEIEKDEQELTNPSLGEAQKQDLTWRLEEKKKRFTANNNFKNALEACIAGKDYDSNQSDVEPAPPSTDGKLNGAGIGVIFAASIAAVLGILAVALPFIKSILPAQLRALLP
ncbi:hypothetical protein FRC0456_01952 [Corynebacterium diphtheriae]|nr:hypothetical protein FRC0084_01943 [Corynebacterium diphtheriae]CAB0761916.1 hypothetical protein FRC0104_02126 [Corynebacterium diphtheriae]CAB0857314.1 hypothetical protein FRC0322_01827 [Corynebacterium diphtheriae]CAB0860685.1 hypothetical protein FRC0332_01986 [Corynebacterium diphtheriae]CAB0872097.1 hypothetical protein FRC0356_02027 [Corynebacterium diphtheriae]